MMHGQEKYNCCVRFVAAVAGGPRNTRYRAVASLTRTELSPAGSDQLNLTHPPTLRQSQKLKSGSHPVWLAVYLIRMEIGCRDCSSD
jgi:hypothetical protein